MKAKEFAEMCYAKKEIQLKEYMNGNESLVAKLKNDLALSTEQEKILYKLVDTVLTDTYLTLLYALDGTTSLGNVRQENFKLYGEDGELVFDSGELEMATYEAFYENKKVKKYMEKNIFTEMKVKISDYILLKMYFEKYKVMVSDDFKMF